jgi:hypothetical protein
MRRHSRRLGVTLNVAALVLLLVPVRAAQISFAPGDMFVSLETTGSVHWYLPDGTLRGVLASTVLGWGEGMAFDATGNLYLAHWRADSMGITGNTVEKFNNLGQSMGAVGSGYDCDPHTIDFDRTGIGYVGQAGCRRSLLQFVPGERVPRELFPAGEFEGLFWMDLASDDCTLFYTSLGPNVKRFDVCANAQLPDFNVTALPGAFTHDLRELPGGGLLVANQDVIVRLDSAGSIAQTYAGPPAEPTLWTGLDIVGDGTFWVANYYTSDVYRIDLASGSIVDSLNTGTPPNTAVDVIVMP